MDFLDTTYRGQPMGLPTDYQSFIHISRYARFRDDLGRRETWEETVARYFDFFQEHLKENFNYDMTASGVRETLEKAVLNLEIMPSMRSLMTAGEALKRSNVAGFNCSYVVVDHPRAFDEAVYILMCGTGVGFSVERQFIAKLPEVPAMQIPLTDEDIAPVIVVEDSKEGWAKIVQQLIDHLYRGIVPKIDYSQVRPAGARLKVFGGRASGPGPLKDLCDFIIQKFVGAEGRKLESIECHDIMCKIGEAVVVGGVRRSAMISLSNLSDDRMRVAKSGSWWENEGQRALANNSIAFTEKPEVGQFMREWNALYDSKSGERGIFNREAANNKIKQIGRRETDPEIGTNPCAEIILHSGQFCNLTEVVLRAEDNVQDISRKIVLATILGTFQSTLTTFDPERLRPQWEENTRRERLLGVSLTGIMDNFFMKNAIPSHLEALKETAIETNKLWAETLGIEQSAAITCVKPSGTVSQLVDSASGIHTRHSAFYIRTVRGDKKDPLTQFMISKGIPHEDCVRKPDTTVVFSFPMKAPEDAATRNDYSAVDHLKIWSNYQKFWCEHNPSVTINVREEEWPEVGAFVWNNFDDMAGVSFLPHSEHTYQQAPYQEIDEEKYLELLTKMPQKIDWVELGVFERGEDNVTSTQELACTGGACEINSIGKNI